jgi:hypothetical protein
MESRDAAQCKWWSSVKRSAVRGGGASHCSQHLPICGQSSWGEWETSYLGLHAIMAPTSLIWCCATGSATLAGWAPPIRKPESRAQLGFGPSGGGQPNIYTTRNQLFVTSPRFLREPKVGLTTNSSFADGQEVNSWQKVYFVVSRHGAAVSTLQETI